MVETPRRDLAIRRLAKSLPPISRWSGTTLFINLVGNVLHVGERGPGIDKIAVEGALLSNPSASHIHVNLRSLGGSVKNAQGIYSALRRHSGFKTVHADGECASAATIILLAGDLRTASPGAKFLVHATATEQPTGGRWTYGRHRRLAEALKHADARLVALYADRTGRDPRIFINEMQNENLLTVDKATHLGLVHCLAGLERWHNGRPHYCGNDLSTALASRSDEHRAIRAAVLRNVISGSAAFFGHVAFTKRAGWRRNEFSVCRSLAIADQNVR